MHVDSNGTQEMMTLSKALNESQNIPAYWTYQTILNSGKSVEPYMEKMGYDIADYTTESLPLGGGIDPTVVQHTNGYQALANGGVYELYYTIQSIKDDTGKVIYEHQSSPTRIYSEATSTIMENLLKGVLDSNITTTFKQNISGLNPALNNFDWAGKTGTSNEYKDAWLMLSTPTVTLGGWIGHDKYGETMGALTGYSNNSSYMANLVNAIYNADPTIFGQGKKFTNPASDPKVTKSTVLESTGERAGTIADGLLKGKSISGNTVTSFWATTDGAPVTQYKFAIGGSDNDYLDAWGKIFPNSNINTKNEDDKKTNTSSSKKDDKKP